MESLLHAPCSNLSDRSLYRVSLTRHILETVSSVGVWIVSVKRPMLHSINFLSFVGWVVSATRGVKSISSFDGWVVSLTGPVLESVRRVRSLSYSSRT